MTIYGSTVVPAIPPRPPQLSLMLSAIRPDNTSDPGSEDAVTPAQRAGLPEGLRAELDERKGDSWVRGFTYAPESHASVPIHDPCDFTTLDTPAIPAPTGLAAVAHVGGGTQTAGLKTYSITAVNGNGETTPSTQATATTILNGTVTLTWDRVENLTYKVYGRVAGSLGLIGTVGPFDADQAATFTDTGTPAPGAVPPVTNTTGGVGPYGNMPIAVVVPYLVIAQDSCSTFGFEQRDYKGRALRLLEHATPKAVEKEFWTGALAQAKGYPNNYLANAATVTDLTGGTAVSVDRGVSMLQQALADCGFGGQGMIHLQPQATPNELRTRRVGNLLLDEFDNILVPGVGYTGLASSIAGSATGTSVMFATDLIAVRAEPAGTVFPDTFAEAVDRGQGGQPNKVTFRAEKFAVAFGDFFCHFGVRVNLPS